MVPSAKSPKKRYAIRELDSGETATDALEWAQQELEAIDRLISDALKPLKN